MKHRGSDPLAIKVADNLGLLFDGMQADYIGSLKLGLLPKLEAAQDYYQFTIASGKGKGITFYVKDLNQVKTRLNEKLREFGLKW